MEELIAQLGARVSDLEHRTQECHVSLIEQRASLDTLTTMVESNQTLFRETLAATKENGDSAYREVVTALRAELRTRMRWILIAVAIGAAIAGGTNLLPSLEMLR